MMLYLYALTHKKKKKETNKYALKLWTFNFSLGPFKRQWQLVYSFGLTTYGKPIKINFVLC